MLTLLIFTLAGAAPSDATPTRLGWRPPRTGDELTLEHRTLGDLPLEIDLGDRKAPSGLMRAHSQQVHYRVNHVIDEAPTQLTVAWSDSHLRERGPDGARDLRLPVSGKTYTVDLATRSVDGAWSSAESETALAASDLFVLVKGIRDMLGDAPLTPGETRPAGALFAGLVRDAPGTPTVSGTLTFLGPRSLDGDALVAVRLEVHLESTGPLSPGVSAALSADLAGELLLDPLTGWTRSLSVAGPVHIQGEGKRFGRAFTLSGTGRFESHTTLTLGSP